jgi:hypothetical protein
MPGHDDLVREMKFDGKTTRAEAMERLIDAEDAKKKKAAVDIRTGRAAAVPSTQIDDPAVAGKNEKANDAKGGEKRTFADGFSPVASKLAKEAEDYRAEMSKKGIEVSNIEAIKFVYERAGVPQQ